MKSNRRNLIIGIALLFGIACNALVPTPAPTPTAVPTDTPTATATIIPTATSTPLPNYDGTWEGTTSQGKPVSVTITDNTVVSIMGEADLASGGCTSDFSATITSKVPITDGAFESIMDLAQQGKFTVKGTFDSEASLSGTIIYESTGGCPGTVEVEWSATKND